MILAPVRLVAEDLPLLPVQQFVHVRDVALERRAGHDAVDRPAPVGSEEHLHPEVPLLVLAGLLYRLGAPAIAASFRRHPDQQGCAEFPWLRGPLSCRW